MDLIYLDKQLREQGVISNVDFDSEIGGKYDFVLKCHKRDYDRLAGCFVYPQGAFAFGGKIEYVHSVSNDGLVKLYGRTWLGLLQKHEFTHAVYVLGSQQGTLNAYLTDLLVAALLYPQITPNTTQSDVTVDGRAYDGNVFTSLDELWRMYDALGIVPTLSRQYTDGVLSVLLGARTAKAYDDYDFSSDAFPLEVEKRFDPVTEIQIGYDVNGTLQGVKTAYMDEDGTWKLPGETVYRRQGFGSCRKSLILSQEEVETPDWDAIIQSVQVQDTAAVSVAGDLQPDVGDTVTGYDQTTGITATARVTVKTLHLTDGVPIYSFETDKGA